MRRLLGPVGGPVAFVLVAGLVFTGLGWVTIAALRVEDAQREAAAEAAVANKLRVALWRLDGRLLPALSVESNRNFQEYAPPDPFSPYGPTCGPLLSGPLPEWMKLHCQFDPETGWESPQVLTPEAAQRFRAAWPELQLLNATPERARALDVLRTKHPFKSNLTLFARDTPPAAEPARRPAEAPAPKMPPPAPAPVVLGGLMDTPVTGDQPAIPESQAERENAQRFRKQTDANSAPALAPSTPDAAPKSAPAPAPPPRPAPRAAEPIARGLERGDIRGEADARRRALELMENGRQSSTYIYPTPGMNPNFRNQNPNGAEQTLQNGLAFGRFAAPGPLGDRTNNRADEKATPGNFFAVPVPGGPADRDTRPYKSEDKATGNLALGTGAGGGYGFGGGVGGFGRESDPQTKGGEGAAKLRAEPSLGALAEFLRRAGKAGPENDATRLAASGIPKMGTFGQTDGLKPHADRAKDYRAGGLPTPAPGGAPPPGASAGGTSWSAPFAGRGPAPAPVPVPPAPPGVAGPGGGAKAELMAKAAPAAPADPKAAEPPVATVAAPPPPPPPAPGRLGGPPELPTPDPAPPPGLQPAELPADGAGAAVPVFDLTPPAVAVHLGPVRPQWLTAADGTETLFLVRAAKLDGRTVYQGVELDWSRLQKVLKDDVKDLFPDATLVPVKGPAEVPPERAMTALPVQLDPGSAAAPPPAGWTPLRIGLALAWAAALIAFGALGLAGWSLIDLSERRIRFVSAVTHELRTPLTSLRLYLDLLLTGMVTDDQKRTEYLSTLNVETDRLHRLVDNVLDFARLERRRVGTNLHAAKVADLLATVRDTWTDRCGTDGKELIVVSTLPPEAEVRTDAALVGQIVGNLIDNARKYTRAASDPRVWVWAKPEGRRLVLEVEDRGPGVAPRERNLIFRAFRRGAGADTTAGGAGLGLALCRQWAESLGGTLTYRPADGDTGACFRLELPGK